MNTRLRTSMIVVFFILVLPGLLLAQGGLADPEAIAGQNLRGYTHLFIAYFIAWAIIFGWVISITRRLGRLEQELGES